ncbi:MAG: Trm112 family protein [Ramlibacter sp.]|nr:Trm112 family protein [Ramlibacter sp.]
MFDSRLLEILACPKTLGPLTWDKDRNVLVSAQAGLAYPIKDGIPVLMVDAAQPVAEKNS